jgi:hypothetical protein
MAARISSAPSERIFVKFDVGDFYLNLCKKSKFGYIWAKASGNLREDPQYGLFMSAT